MVEIKDPEKYTKVHTFRKQKPYAPKGQKRQLPFSEKVHEGTLLRKQKPYALTRAKKAARTTAKAWTDRVVMLAPLWKVSMLVELSR